MAERFKGYRLVDSGWGRKLEQFGSILVDRPSACAPWKPALKKSEWNKARLRFERLTDRDGKWEKRGEVPEFWTIDVDGLCFKISPTPFGHLGIFPEQRPQWNRLRELCKSRADQPVVLNLFAYSGGSSIACASGGAQVHHVDASRPMITWARENANLTGLKGEGISWVVEDVQRFMQRQKKRGQLYDGVILDPPSFGRGLKKELFKIEDHLPALLDHCFELLSANPSFLLLSAHTPGYTPITLENLLKSHSKRGGQVESNEMCLTGDEGTAPLPSGAYALMSFWDGY